MPFEKTMDVMSKGEVSGFLGGLMQAIRPVIDIIMESVDMIRKGM